MLLAVSLQLFDIYFLWKSFLYYFLKLFLLEGAVITFFVLNVNLLLSPFPDALNSTNWGIFISVWYFVSHYWFEPMSIATNNWTSNHSTKSMSCYHMTDKYLSSSSHEPFSRACETLRIVSCAPFHPPTLAYIQSAPQTVPVRPSEMSFHRWWASASNPAAVKEGRTGQLFQL